MARASAHGLCNHLSPDRQPEVEVAQTAETLIDVIAERDPPAAGTDERLAEVRQRTRGDGRGVLAVAGAHDEPGGVLADPEAGD